MDPATAALLCTIQKALGALCALLLLGRPAGLLEVAALLNCDPKTTRKHLDLLVRQQLVSRKTFREGYTVAPRGLNFWFGECGKFSHSGASSTATDPLDSINLLQSEEEAAAVKVGKNGFSRKAPGNGREVDEPLNEAESENLAAFREEGLGLNQRVRQACRLPHVSPEYIRAQARRLHLEKRYNPGLLLLVVEAADPFPDGEQLLDPQDPRRYVIGKYADYIVSGD